MPPEQLQMIISLIRQNPEVLQAITGGKIGSIKKELDNLEYLKEIEVSIILMFA